MKSWVAVTHQPCPHNCVPLGSLTEQQRPAPEKESTLQFSSFLSAALLLSIVESFKKDTFLYHFTQELNAMEVF